MLMPFGKYINHPIETLPIKYLEYLLKHIPAEDWFTPGLKGYIEKVVTANTDPICRAIQEWQHDVVIKYGADKGPNKVVLALLSLEVEDLKRRMMVVRQNDYTYVESEDHELSDAPAK